MAGEARTELRAQLGAAGALLGIPVTVTDDDAWTLDDDGLRVGLGWYGARGHGEAESVALALLQLWEGVRAEHESPDRARRRRTLARTMPHADPLLAAIARLQAGAELLVALPGMRAPLGAALHRSLPRDLEVQPRHLQWVLLLLGIGFRAPIRPEADPAVLAEWRALAAPASDSNSASASRPVSAEDALRRVIALDPERTPLRRFERALALLLPAYERLLALDVAGRGIADARPDGAIDVGAEAIDAAGPSDAAGAEGAGSEADEKESAGEAAPAESESERARAGEGRDAAEGADLFAAEHAAFVESMLSTPMPAEGALFEAVMELVTRRPESGRDAGAAVASGPGTAAGVAGETALTAYRSRVEELAGPIERMRDVWARVIAERVARTRATGRRALHEGDELVPEALASAVADALAGVARPRAYRQREERSRRARRAGSTDYVLLIDRSASMGGAAAEAAADAALIMLEALAGVERDVAHAEAVAGPSLEAAGGLELDLRTALIVFDSSPHAVKPLSAGLDDRVRRELHAAIRSPRGATNDAAALREAAAQFGIGRTGGGSGPGSSSGSGLERRRIAIVISDGGTNDAVAATHALRSLRAAGVRVHGVGIGSDDVVQRYAPSSQRLDDPRRIAEALQRLVEDELP